MRGTEYKRGVTDSFNRCPIDMDQTLKCSVITHVNEMENIGHKQFNELKLGPSHSYHNIRKCFLVNIYF